MDQLGKTMNNLSLWEVKSYVRKAQNAVLNLSEIETKVREATNNEPWGASTSLMAEIARGTFNYRDREEICNMIFRRFTEKSAHEWRQIYKSLQLMEYLIKNGSERFVDDARANVSLVSMLKSFHYIDSKGVDQGINIRNRAKELTNLLNDESKIRQERRKAKENSKKFDAISSTSVGTRNLHAATNRSRRAGAGSSSRNVATDDDGYENRIFGDGGVYGQRFEEPRTNVASPNEFEEYHEDTTPESTTATNHRTSKPTTQTTTAPARAAPIDLFDDFTSAPAPAAAATEDFDDDEFDDFQSATPATTTTASNGNGNGNGNLSDLLSSSYAPRTPAASTATPTPVISQPVKSDDIFGSLLVSAKQTSHTVPARTSAPAPARSTPTATRAASSTASAPAPAPSKNTDIIDLLDL